MENINTNNLIPVAKGIPPYMPYTNGYGYLGVVLMDSEGKLQCHVCGDTFDHIPAHVFNTHKIHVSEYKEMVSLNRSTVLLSPRTRDKMSETRKNDPACIEAITKARAMRTFAKKGPALGEATKRVQFRNRYGTCDAQLKARFDELAKEVGGTPTYEQCPFAGVILNRFGTWNKGVEAMGYTPNPSSHDLEPHSSPVTVSL